jgi:competence protein ComEC
LITGLVYHGAVPAICLALLVLISVIEVYTFRHEFMMKRLEVSFLNIGQGDASLIQIPGGQSILIDGGPPHGPILSEIGSTLPFYKKHIDVIIATHPDADHIGGLTEVVERYDPSVILVSGVHADTWVDKSLQQKIGEHAVQGLRARKGMTLNFASSDSRVATASLKIIFPDRNVDEWTGKTNDASIVARMEYGSTSFMFTGDSPVDIEHYLFSTNQLIHTDVLKVGHHGSKTSTSDEYVKALSPAIGVISVGKKNRYGHPNQEAMDILKNNNVDILRTDHLGRIKIESDGIAVKIDR